MRLSKLASAFIAFISILFASATGAQTLYGASGSNGVAGVLYTINSGTGASVVVGPILAGATPLSITGLAMHPLTGVLYGAVGNNTANFPSNLVTINTATGAATVVGAFGTAVSDIAFNAAGTLFAWDRNTNRLATVNTATGAATDLGASGLAAFAGGGGLAINAGGTAFVSATLTTPGTLDSVNTATGAGTTGPALTGGPLVNGAMTAMAFSTGGVLFAIDSNRSGSPTTNSLVTINTATGAITNIGALPGDMDGLAFAVPLAGAPANIQVPTLGEWALILLATILAAVGVVSLRRARR
jgi:hypothetical protein